MSLRGRFLQSIHSMEIPLAFPEKKFKATTSVRHNMGTLFRGKHTCSCGYPYRGDTVNAERYCGRDKLENLEKAVSRKGPSLMSPSTVTPGPILPAGMALRLGAYETHYRQTRPRDRLNNTWLTSDLRKTPTWSKTPPSDEKPDTDTSYLPCSTVEQMLQIHWGLEANLVPHKGSWTIRSTFIYSPLLHVSGTVYGHLQGVTNFRDLYSTYCK
jgi:hypothetical protein